MGSNEQGIYVHSGRVSRSQLRVAKIWVPESRADIMQNKLSDFKLGWSEEDRNRQVAQWGVEKPYVLFSRHRNMGAGFPIPSPQRFNELVIYPQVQENLILTIRLSDSELNSASNVYYEGKVRDWNITIAHETRTDFSKFGENIG